MFPFIGHLCATFSQPCQFWQHRHFLKFYKASNLGTVVLSVWEILIDDQDLPSSAADDTIFYLHFSPALIIYQTIVQFYNVRVDSSVYYVCYCF